MAGAERASQLATRLYLLRIVPGWLNLPIFDQLGRSWTTSLLAGLRLSDRVTSPDKLELAVVDVAGTDVAQRLRALMLPDALPALDHALRMPYQQLDDTVRTSIGRLIDHGLAVGLFG